MEIKAYLEGILRSWWVLVLIMVIGFFIGNNIANNQTIQYEATTTILINGPLLANTAISLNVGQISTPLVYESQITSPNLLTIINKHYPQLNPITLAKLVSVGTDASNQLLTIKFAYSSPAIAADVVNYLAQQFVQKETADLKHQLDFYESSLKQSIPALINNIDTLNTTIQNLTTSPPPGQGRSTRQTLVISEYQVNADESTLFTDQEALQDIQRTRPLFASAYVITQPAVVSNSPTSSALSGGVIKLLAVLIGLLLGIILLITVEYFNPCIRHKGEIQRIIGLPVLAELPRIFRFEQTRLLQLRPLLFQWRMKALLLLCTSIGAPAMRDNGYTVLVTSPRKRHNFTAILAMLVAHSGFKTLIVDADFDNPRLPQQIRLTDPYNERTQRGFDLSFIRKTVYPRLFMLPANAVPAQGEQITSPSLVQLLPELQSSFDIIILNAPPIDHADTHLLATKAKSTLLLVRKRRDSINTMRVAYSHCEKLNLKVQSLLV
jgi:capsular polysaccharide biosynthesis protein